MKPTPIIWLMLLAITAIGALAYLDAERESSAALSDFAQEQATLAQSLAADLSAQLAAAHHDALAVAQSHVAGQPLLPAIVERYLSVVVRPQGTEAAPPPSAGDRAVRLSFPAHSGAAIDLTVALSSLLSDLKATERPNRVMLLLRPPAAESFRTTDGRLLEAREIISALDAGRSFLRLSPAEAGRLGLPARTALAGLARIDAGAAGPWGIAAVASAERERDRERWAGWRLILSVAAASGLVLTFGGLAMRNQRKELLLQHQLALADLSRQRDERLERAGRAATMGALAVGVAHEISTPLGIIAGRAEQLVPKVSSDERAAGSVRIILEQIDRIHRVIRGLLGLARGDRPTAEPIEPAALVRDAMSLVEHRFQKADVPLVAEIAPTLPTIYGDPRLLEHALVNLLLNACDACALGGEVKVTALTGDAGRALVINVIDDGPGISHQDAGRVLEPFFSTKPSGGGTGLGLAIVQEIVASHRGSLLLESVAPHGTRAVISIPATEEPAHA
jgi:signal transduction histidine kinase